MIPFGKSSVVFSTHKGRRKIIEREKKSLLCIKIKFLKIEEEKKGFFFPPYNIEAICGALKAKREEEEEKKRKYKRN